MGDGWHGAWKRSLPLCRADSGKIRLCNVGDSRIYRFWKGRLELLTHDQTLAQQMLDMGCRSLWVPVLEEGNAVRGEKTERLVEAALENGGEDNVTAMLLEGKER